MQTCDVLPELYWPNKTTLTHGGDQSAKKIYSLNSLGFRGEEYNANARFRVAFFGCSNVFGVGVNHEETFAHQFKMLLSEAWNMAPEDINIMNFSIGGGSNDLISRYVISQASNTFDLAIISPTYLGRYEHAEGLSPRLIKLTSLVDRMRQGNITSRRELQGKYDRTILAYFDLHSDSTSAINAVKNLTVAQHHLENNNTDIIFNSIFVDLDEIFQLCSSSAYQNLINKKYICNIHDQWRTFWESGHRDFAADDAHPGPQSHEWIALRLIKFYAERLIADGKFDKGKALLDHFEKIDPAARAKWSQIVPPVHSRQKETDNLDEARVKIKASPLENNHPACLFYLATAAFNEKAFDDAERFLTQVISKDPCHPVAHEMIARIFNKKSNHEAALNHINTAIKLMPTFARLYCTKANIYRAMSDFEPALSRDGLCF